MTSADRILVTGAGGFIGGRVVEVLQGAGLGQVRAVVRRWGSAPRIGRLPVEIVLCDITDSAQVDAAMEGVTAVVHCAHGPREVNVDGTRVLLEAASKVGVRRFVHVSTIAVYGARQGDVDEGCAPQRTGSEYGDTKLAGEEVCRQYLDKGVPVSILRPTIVYGPFSASWTIEFAQRLRAGSWLIPNEYSQGVCNLVYVDDLVQAILLALRKETAVGQAFNVNGPERVTWSDYFHALNDALGLQPLHPEGATRSRLSASAMMPVRKLAKLLLKHFEGPIMAVYQRYGLARAAMRRMEGLIRKTPTTAEFQLYSQTTYFRTDKAQSVLGYRPAFSMSEGVQLSAVWLKHHRFV